VVVQNWITDETRTQVMSNRLVPPSILNSPWQASSRVRGAVQDQFHFGTLCLDILVVETLNPAVRRVSTRPSVMGPVSDRIAGADDEGKIKQAGSKPREQMTISTSSPASTLVEMASSSIPLASLFDCLVIREIRSAYRWLPADIRLLKQPHSDLMPVTPT
jgi:hypothetical protein